MKFGLSMFADAFLGSGVPLGGDPLTSFQVFPFLGLRTATILDTCKLMVGDVVKGRFIATNCGARRLEVVRAIDTGCEPDQEYSERNAVILIPGASVEYSVCRSWDRPGQHQFTLAYEVRYSGHPFARLTYPTVAVHVTAPSLPWTVWARVPHLEGQC